MTLKQEQKKNEKEKSIQMHIFVNTTTCCHFGADQEVRRGLCVFGVASMTSQQCELRTGRSPRGRRSLVRYIQPLYLHLASIPTSFPTGTAAGSCKAAATAIATATVVEGDINRVDDHDRDVILTRDRLRLIVQGLAR